MPTETAEPTKIIEPTKTAERPQNHRLHKPSPSVSPEVAEAAAHFTRNTDATGNTDSPENSQEAEADGIFPPRPKFSMIEHSRISPSPLNPRKHFAEDGLIELADSLRQHGMQQPLVVRQHILNHGAGGGNTVVYSIVMGERRWRAAKMAGMSAVPAIVRTDLDDLKHAELAMEENVRRRDLSPIEEANGYAKLMELGKTQAEIGEGVGVKQARISSIISLLKLPQDVQERIATGEIKAGHGIALLRWKDWPSAVSLIAAKIESYNFSVRTLETGDGLGYNIRSDLGNTRLTGKPLAVNVSDYRVHPVCQKCPFHAFFHGVCLNPPHYADLVAAKAAEEKQAREDALAAKHKTQQLARTAAKYSGQGYPPEAMERLAEEDQAEEEAQQKEQSAAPAVSVADKPVSGLPRLSALPSDSYQLLNGSLPSGCNGQCDCSGLALDNKGTQVKICTKPRRFANHQQADQALKSSEEAMVKKQLLADCLLITGGINPSDEAVKLALAVDALLVARTQRLRQQVFLHHAVLDRVTPDLWPLYDTWDKEQDKIRKRLTELAALGTSALITIAAEIVLRRDLVAVTDAAYGDHTTLGHKAQWLYDQRFPAADVPAEAESVTTSVEPTDDAGIQEDSGVEYVGAYRLYPCTDCKAKDAGAFYVDADGYDVDKHAMLGDWVCDLCQDKRKAAAQAEQTVCTNCKEPLTTGAFESAIAAAAARQNPLRMNTGELLLPDGRAFCEQCGPNTDAEGNPTNGEEIACQDCGETGHWQTRLLTGKGMPTGEFHPSMLCSDCRSFYPDARACKQCKFIRTDFEPDDAETCLGCRVSRASERTAQEEALT